MRRPTFPRALVVLLAVVVVVCGPGLPVFAASLLTSIRVDAQSSGGAQITVGFTGGLPRYHVVGAGTAETSVVFDGTQLGPQVAPALVGAGAVTSMTLSQTSTSASLSLHLAGAVAVRIRAGGTVLVVDVPPLTSATAAAQGGGTAASAATGLGPVTEVVPLKYADVSEIAGVLVQGSNVASNDNFSPVSANIGTSSLGGTFGGFQQQVQQPQTFGGGQFGQQQGLAQRLNDNIAIDRRLNAIVLTGPADVVAQLKAAIDKLDIPVQSVILEAEIVELNDTAARNIGLDLSPDGSGVIVNGTNAVNGGGLLIKSLQTSQGALTLQANLYAQISLGNGRILSKPRILSQSGQQASILTGEAIPILTSVVVTGGSALTSQQVNYVNVGVNLQIQPRVSSDGYVTSHVYSEVSSVTQFVSGVPQISQRTANTIATVKDGESFVVGGLLQDNEIKSLTKLPFIGDVPLIGQFFRHVTTSHTQTNLYIVVTPHVVGNVASPPPQGRPLVIPSALPQVTPPPSLKY